MKYVLMSILAMAVIIAVQMGLACVFNFRVGEIFSKTAMSALFFFCILKLLRAGRRAEA